MASEGPKPFSADEAKRLATRINAYWDRKNIDAGAVVVPIVLKNSAGASVEKLFGVRSSIGLYVKPRG